VRLRRAYHEALSRFARRPDVTAIDVGYRYRGGRADPEEMCIRVHLREKRDEDALRAGEIIPDKIGGVATDVIQASYVPHAGWYSGEPERRQPVPVIQPGVSVGPQGGAAGTLGLIGRDRRSGGQCILSCAHILASQFHAEPGDPVLQPAPSDQGHAADQIGRLLRWDPLYDWGVASMEGARQWSPVMYGTNVQLTGIRWPAPGDVLRKSGRTTGVTEAVVDGVGTYMGLNQSFRLVPPDPTKDVEISYVGDSGSIWYDPATGQGVGMLVQGEILEGPQNEWAVATMLPLVLYLAEVDLV
jgi:hypothetical protein